MLSRNEYRREYEQNSTDWSRIKKGQSQPGHRGSSWEGGQHSRKFQRPKKMVGTKRTPWPKLGHEKDVTQNKLSPWSLCNYTQPVINTGSLEAWETIIFRRAQNVSKWNLDFSLNGLCGCPWNATDMKMVEQVKEQVWYFSAEDKMATFIKPEAFSLIFRINAWVRCFLMGKWNFWGKVLALYKRKACYP